MRNLLFTLFTLVTVVTFAQSKGTVSGIVQDKDMGLEPLPFVSIFDEKDSSVGTTSDIDGLYTIKLSAGVHTLVFDYVGYETIKKQITVKAGSTQKINIVMASAADALDAVILTAVVNKESEEALVEVQKEAVEMKVAIGAEEMSKKGVSNVAAAVTKSAGVTKQEGGSGSIFVRGLGDRYNVTTLNGLPLPSNNPSNKNISLDLFSTDIVQYVGISKTFEAQNYADFGGANIDINSKKFSGSPYVKLNIGAGTNSNLLDLDNFYQQDGPSYFGFKTVEVPDDAQTPNNYETSWDRTNINYLLNNSLSVSGGKSFEVSDEGKISTFFTASFDADNSYREGIASGGLRTSGGAKREYDSETYKRGTNTTVMGTINYEMNSENSILFNTMYLNSTSQNYSEYRGTNEDFSGFQNSIYGENYGIIQRGTYERTQLIVNQLLGDHKITNQFKAKWAVGYNLLDNVVPDRMQNSFVPDNEDGNNFTFFTDSAIDNHRFFQNLTDNEFSTNVALEYSFNDKEESGVYKGVATLGYSGRFKNVDYSSELYAFDLDTVFIFDLDETNNVDNIFTVDNFNSGEYHIDNKIAQYYEGTQSINSIYGSLKYELTPKFTSIIGVRAEFVNQEIDYVSSQFPNGDGSTFSVFKILPSFIGKYKLNENQNLKLAFSQTYTLPQFKEKARILFEEVTQNYIGNADLYASTNYNFDLGYELYPEKGELISLTAFAKFIQNPINEVFINSASGDISYLNSGELATAIGVEFEMRKKIFEFDHNDRLNKLSLGLNGSYIYQKQDLDEDKVKEETDYSASFTFDDVELAGASKILANADISFNREVFEEGELTSTITYSYFSDKLAVIGTQGRGNLVDKAVGTLDFVNKIKINDKFKVGISVKNLTNPIYERILDQSSVEGSEGVSDVVVESFKRGIGASFSLGYTF